MPASSVGKDIMDGEINDTDDGDDKHMIEMKLRRAICIEENYR